MARLQSEKNAVEGKTLVASLALTWRRTWHLQKRLASKPKTAKGEITSSLGQLLGDQALGQLQLCSSTGSMEGPTILLVATSSPEGNITAW